MYFSSYLFGFVLRTNFFIFRHLDAADDDDDMTKELLDSLKARCSAPEDGKTLRKRRQLIGRVSRRYLPLWRNLSSQMIGRYGGSFSIADLRPREAIPKRNSNRGD